MGVLQESSTIFVVSEVAVRSVITFGGLVFSMTSMIAEGGFVLLICAVVVLMGLSFLSNGTVGSWNMFELLVLSVESKCTDKESNVGFIFVEDGCLSVD